MNNVTRIVVIVLLIALLFYLVITFARGVAQAAPTETQPLNASSHLARDEGEPK